MKKKPKPLFTLESDYNQNLKAGNINENLRTAFEKNNHPLSEIAKIYKIDEKKWKIKDEKIFLIEDTGKDLKIYKSVNEKIPMLPRQKAFIGIYCVVFVGLVLYVLGKTWPDTDCGNYAGTVTYIPFISGGIDVIYTEEQRIIFLVCLAGALGGGVYMGISFAYHTAIDDLEKQYWYWYLSRPFVGASLAVIVYFLLRGGLFSSSASNNDINLYTVIAIACLVGMFSKQAIAKLTTIANQLFEKGNYPEKDEKEDEGKENEGITEINGN